MVSVASPGGEDEPPSGWPGEAERRAQTDRAGPLLPAAVSMPAQRLALDQEITHTH